MLTFEQAKENMARLMLAERDEHRKLYAEPPPAGPFMFGFVSGDVVDVGKDDRAHKEAQHAVGRYGEELGSMPQFRDLMSCWMVDVTGKGSPTEETMREAIEAIESLDPEEASRAVRRVVEKIGGNLCVAVHGFITDALGMTITDRGGGVGGWHVGVPCNDPEARRLCNSLHVRFSHAVRVGLISVLCRFWKWRLPGLSNWDDAERYARERGWEAT